MNYIGIDPGKSGAIAIYHSDLDILEAVMMPIEGNEIDIGRIAKLFLDSSPCIITIELVHSMPHDNVKGAFSFGQSYGIMKGVTGALGLRTELVTPQCWKNEVLRGTTKDKAAAIAYCQRVFPKVSLLPTKRSSKPHDGKADALCILEYARRKFKYQ
jgi:crossover junction endodeoxyribonuclease RuvC